MDTSGVYLAEPVYAVLLPMEGQRLLLVRKDKKSGFLDMNGKIIIPIRYDMLQPDGGRFIFSLDSISGVMDSNEKIINQFDFRIISNLENGFIIERGGRQGIADSHGNIWFSPIYDAVHPDYMLWRNGILYIEVKKRVARTDRYGNIAYLDKDADH